MRIAHCVRAIFPQHGYGGLERAGAALTRHLLANGVSVALYTRPLPPGHPFESEPGWEGRLTVHGVPYGKLPLRPNGIPARLTNYRAFVEGVGGRVERSARKGYLDGVYAQGLCAWGVRRASEWGVPLVANPQGMEDFKVRDPLKRLAYAPFRAWVRAGCRAADRVIATDYSNRQEVPALLGVEPGRVVVIPNGVDLEELRAYERHSVQTGLIERWPHLSPENRALKGISVGRLEDNKGFEYLLRALSLAGPSLEPGWGWIIVGDGTKWEDLIQLVGELGLGESVHFAGSVGDPELHNLYALANLFAHPTLYEGSSLVTLEALAHGLPVVATRVGGIPDKVIHGVSGFLVAPRDAAAMAQHIAWLAGRPEQSREMGARGQELAKEKFAWGAIAQQTEALFSALLEEKMACRPIRTLPRQA